MKSSTIQKLKLINKLCIITTIYYLGYNWYFGFNENALSVSEKTCDNIMKGLIGFMIGLFLSALSSFMILVIRFIQQETFK